MDVTHWDYYYDTYTTPGVLLHHKYLFAIWQTRALSPFPAVGSIHALPITATMILEIIDDMVATPVPFQLQKSKITRKKWWAYCSPTTKWRRCARIGLTTGTSHYNGTPWFRPFSGYRRRCITISPKFIAQRSWLFGCIRYPEIRFII